MFILWVQKWAMKVHFTLITGLLLCICSTSTCVCWSPWSAVQSSCRPALCSNWPCCACSQRYSVFWSLSHMWNSLITGTSCWGHTLSKYSVLETTIPKCTGRSIRRPGADAWAPCGPGLDMWAPKLLSSQTPRFGGSSIDTTLGT